MSSVPAGALPSRQQPQSQPRYAELKASVHKKLLGRLNLEALAHADRTRAENENPDAARGITGGGVDASQHVRTRGAVRRGAGRGLRPWPSRAASRDPTVNDILVNTHKSVYVERSGLLERATATFRDDSHLMRVIDRIVSNVGRRVDDSSPMVDARLADGSRVNAIIPPLAVDGPLLSIRRFPAERLRAEDLVKPPRSHAAACWTSCPSACVKRG